MKKELFVKLVIYKDYTEMLHGQQNIKFPLSLRTVSVTVTSHKNGILRYFRLQLRSR